KTKFSRFLKLDEDFAFFLGVFVADGSVNKNRGYIRLYFGKSKPFYKEVKTRVISFLQKKNIKFKLFQISEKLEELRVYSQLLAIVLTDVLKVGVRGVKNRRSEEKDIPNILFIAPRRVKKAFVEAYIKSDGSPNGNNFVVSTVSERIYKKLPYLSHSCDFPVVFTTKRKTPKGVIYIGHTVSYKKVKKYWGNLVSVKIIEIEEIKDYPYPWIYDLSVDTDTEGNFICGRGGVCQHNTDPGREGELIAREILQMAGWKNWDKTYRFWTSEALTPEVIRKHLKNLKPAREFDSLYYSALARQHADWVVGINFTRLATLKSNTGDVWSVGRVQTPTLRLIVEREEEIKNFQPEEYFVIKATFQKKDTNYEGILIRDKSFIEKLLKEDIKDLEPLEDE
ncbi:MAG: DNA topoisomerase, partial [Aquificota bacterium]